MNQSIYNDEFIRHHLSRSLLDFTVEIKRVRFAKCAAELA